MKLIPMKSFRLSPSIPGRLRPIAHQVRMSAAVCMAVMIASSAFAAQPPEAWQRLAAEFDAGTKLRATDHFLVVYDTPDYWADGRAKLLETGYANFVKTMMRAGFELTEPKQRLVAVVFDEHDDFVDYAAAKDNRAIDWTSGYYTGRSNRIVMFNYLNSPKLRELSTRIERLRSEMHRLTGEIAGAKYRNNHSRAASMGGRLNTVRRQLTELQNRYQAQGGWSNLSITFHEAAHMFAFNTGVQSRFTTNPIWLSEGLATGFETIAPAAGFGPAFHNPTRHRLFSEALRAGKLQPLDQFVVWQSDDLDRLEDEPRQQAYGQAWALFHFLFTERTEELRNYTQALAGRHGRKSDDQLRKLFVEAFGSFAQVESDWRAYFKNYKPKK